MKPVLEGALVDEFAKAGIQEPKRIYRPAIAVRGILDETGEALDRIHRKLQETLPWLPTPKSTPVRSLYKWEIIGNGLQAQYSLRERQYNPNFSMAGVDAAILTGNYDEEIAIAEAQTEFGRRQNDIIICAARDNGKFSIASAENLGHKYDIRAIQKLKGKKNVSVVDFSKEVAKILSRVK